MVLVLVLRGGLIVGLDHQGFLLHVVSVLKGSCLAVVPTTTVTTPHKHNELPDQHAEGARYQTGADT
jgi:hypothetical protein